MLRSVIPCVLLVAACQYAGRDLGADADPDRPDGANEPDAPPVPDAGPNDPDAMIVVDSDGDGVPDGSDNCPGDSNAAQYNEDGDDRGDACDACPHRSGAVPGGDADGDGDGIGDQCDPRAGTDRLVVFLDFNDAGDFSAFSVREGTAAWTVGGGALHLTATTSGQPQQVVWTGESIEGTVAIDTDVVIDGIPEPANPGTRLAAVVGAYWETTAPVDAFACGLRSTSGNGAATVAAWHYVNPPTVNVVEVATFTGNLSVGASGRLHLLASDNAAAASTLDCAADSATVSATVSGYEPAGMPGFRTLGASASFEYLFVVDVGP
jgi:hypothetical protein